MSDKMIEFYGTRGSYGFLSNFHLTPFESEGKIYQHSEAYFQSMKFPTQPEVQEMIRNCESPAAAARMGRSQKFKLRPDWEAIKDDVMRRALEWKFAAHPNLMAELLKTKGYFLVEHTVNDHYWADGGDGSGKNMLGMLLVELRDGRQTTSQAAAIRPKNAQNSDEANVSNSRPTAEQVEITKKRGRQPNLAAKSDTAKRSRKKLTKEQ